MAKTYSRHILKEDIPQYAYALAILSGGGAYLTSQVARPLTTWFIYTFLAALFGFIWPYRATQWGGWLCLPIAILIFLYIVITENIVGVFLFSGVMLVKALAFACLGAYVGSKLSIRRSANHVAHRKKRRSKRNRAGNRVVLKKPSTLHASVKTFSPGGNAHHPAASPVPVARLSTVNAALMSAAGESDSDVIKLLLADGAEVNAQSSPQWESPGLAARDFDVEEGWILFGKGTSPTPSGGKGWSPLMVATIEGHREVVRSLLAQGAQVDAENYRGWTALRYAVAMDEAEILRLLLDAGADANVTDHEGQTALMQAARENSRDSLKTLLDAGADPLIEDGNRQTALRIAQKHSHMESIGLLEEAEARVSPGIETPVHKVRFGPARLLLAAAIFHLALTLTIFFFGRYALFPTTFDKNGVGISFAIDGLRYRDEAETSSNSLRRGEILNWLNSDYPIHVRLYAVCFALFGPLVGPNILSAEPLNIFSYLMILTLVFRIGQEVFSRRAGLLAATAVALWPSLLLHTTQFLRDPLFVAGMLALVLILLRLTSARIYSWKSALLMGGGGGLAAAALWVVRDNMGEIVLATVFVGALMIIVRQFGSKRVQVANLFGITLLMVMTIGAQRIIPRLSPPGYIPPAVTTQTSGGTLSSGAAGEIISPVAAEAPPSIWSRMAAPVLGARRKFIARYVRAGSNIDNDVRLTGMGDLIRYLPRAAVIGFFAPFPEMWFTAGKQVGSAGRLLAGAESFIIYLVEAFALFGLWRGRRRPEPWFLFLVAAAGMIALGLVVTNIAALFRMRFVFLILIIILGVEGMTDISGRFSKKPAAREP